MYYKSVIMALPGRIMLHYLFCMSYISLCFPAVNMYGQWSRATPSPILKMTDATNLHNCRAIAVGSVLGKVYAVI
jgi:hypothetical protein